MWRTLVVFGVIICDIIAISVASPTSPSYLIPCHKNDPDFQKCCVTNGNKALPSLIKGDKQLKLPNMLPLKLPKVDVDAGPNLKLTFTDIIFYGLNTAKLTDMNVDFGQQAIYLVVKADRASLIGTYEIDGKIMILPVTGHGPANITIDNGEFKYSFKYKLEVKDGKRYAIIQDDDKLEWDIKKSYFHLDNLFNGNKEMGDNVNNFLNENDQDVLKELGGALTGVIRAISRLVGNGVLGNIPFDELFLD